MIKKKGTQNEVRATSSDTPDPTEPEQSSRVSRMFYAGGSAAFVNIIMYFLPPPPHPHPLPAGGVLLSKTQTSSDTRLTAGGGRERARGRR